MERLTHYFRESYEELMHRVTWPTFADLQHSTMVVLVASVIIAFLIWAIDTVSNIALGLIY